MENDFKKVYFCWNSAPSHPPNLLQMDHHKLRVTPLQPPQPQVTQTHTSTPVEQRPWRQGFLLI